MLENEIKRPIDPAIAHRIPPGQYLTEKFPVLHYGPTPKADLSTWDLKVFGYVGLTRHYYAQMKERRRGVIINVTGGPDMSLLEVNEALTIIQDSAHEDANIIFGATIDEDLDDQVWVTVIAMSSSAIKSS